MQSHLPNVRKHRAKWAVLALVLICAFFLIWTLGNYGTPARTAVDPPLTADPFPPPPHPVTD